MRTLAEIAGGVVVVALWSAIAVMTASRTQAQDAADAPSAVAWAASAVQSWRAGRQEVDPLLAAARANP